MENKFILNCKTYSFLGIFLNFFLYIFIVIFFSLIFDNGYLVNASLNQKIVWTSKISTKL